MAPIEESDGRVEDGRVEDQDKWKNKLLFFKSEFDPELYLAHVHKITTEWDIGIRNLEQNTHRNKERQKDEMARQFSRYARCKSTMDQLSGDSLKNDIQRPLSDMEGEFKTAHEENYKSLKPIIDAQQQIDHQKREMVVLDKFMGEFDRVNSLEEHIDAKAWSHLVNESKQQERRKSSQVKKFGKMMQLSQMVDEQLVKGRAALLEDIKDNVKVDATSVERKITQLEDLGEARAAHLWMENAIVSMDKALRDLNSHFVEELAQVKEIERKKTMELNKNMGVIHGRDSGCLSAADCKIIAQIQDEMNETMTHGWLEEVLVTRRFYQEMSRVIETRLPLYTAVFKKLMYGHDDNEVRTQAQSTMPKMENIIQLYCELFKDAMLNARGPCTRDPAILEQVNEIQQYTVDAPRMVLISMHGCAIADGIMDKLRELHQHALENHISTVCDEAACNLAYFHLEQNWIQDRDNSNATQMTIDFVTHVQELVDSVEALLQKKGGTGVHESSSMVPRLVSLIGTNMMDLFKIFLDNVHMLAFGGSASCVRLKEEQKRLLFLINDLRVVKTDKLHGVVNDFERKFNSVLPPQLRDEHYKISDSLEQLMLNRYVFLKAKMLNQQITNSVLYCGFQWDKNFDLEFDEPPWQVRTEVMEMLLSLVEVHSQLFAHFASNKRETRGPLVRGLISIVDSIATAFTVGSRMPDRYSQDGAWQFLVDVKFVHFVCEKYRSDFAKQAFADLESKFMGAATSKGAPERRQEVKMLLDRIFERTKTDTEHLFSCLSMRRDLEHERLLG